MFGLVRWCDSHELCHDAITLYAVADLNLLLVELQADLGIPHQFMPVSAQKAQVVNQGIALCVALDVLPLRHGIIHQLVAITARVATALQRGSYNA